MKTHRHCLLHATGSAGMMMVGLCSLDWLREGDWCGGWDSNWIEGGQRGHLKKNLIGRKSCEKKLERWGKIEREGKTHSRSLLQASWQQWALDPFID